MASSETTDSAPVTGRRWLTTRVPEAARRALLGAFACVVGSNAGDRDVAWGLAFLRALASEAYLDLPAGAADDVEPLATGAWPEGDIPRHCFLGGSAGEWAERWTPDDEDDDVRERPTRTASSSRASPNPWARCLRELLAAFVEHNAYAANVRAAFRRVALAADVSWGTILVAEDRLAGTLRAANAAEEAARAAAAESSTTEREDAPRATAATAPRAPSRAPSSSDVAGENRTGARSATSALAKWIQVGGAATLGGVALVLTGGVAAPALVGTLTALGATGGLIGAAAGGVAATLSAMGGTVGICVMFGGAGAGLAGYKMARRTVGLTEFSFEPLRGEDDGLGVVIYAPGFHVLRHRLRDSAAFAFAAEANPADVFGCWGGEESDVRAVFVRPVRIGWTVRDVPDDRGVNHATIVRIVPGSPAEAAGINVGAVVKEMLTPEGLEWPVACAEDCDAMADRRPLMVRLRRCAPVVPDAEIPGTFGKPYAWDDEEETNGSGKETVLALGGETMFVDRFAFAAADDDVALRRRMDAQRARRERADREAHHFRAPSRKKIGRSSSRMLRLETGFEEENGGGGGGGGGPAGIGASTMASIFFDDGDEEHSRSDDDASEREDEGWELASWRPRTCASSWDTRDADRPREPLPAERPGAGPGTGLGAGEGPGAGKGPGARSDPWRREVARGAGGSTTVGTEMREMEPTPEEVRPRVSAFEPIPSWRTRFVSRSPGIPGAGARGRYRGRRGYRRPRRPRTRTSVRRRVRRSDQGGAWRTTRRIERRTKRRRRRNGGPRGSTRSWIKPPPPPPLSFPRVRRRLPARVRVRRRPRRTLGPSRTANSTCFDGRRISWRRWVRTCASSRASASPRTSDPPR